jgi:hypothetical protein
MATPTLFTYLTECRRLLHDANARFWSDTELTDYINDGRNQVVRDTGCLRVIQTVNLLAGQETYSLPTLNTGQASFDVLNLSVIWGSTRYPLQYLDFTRFNARMRAWSTMQGRPVMFTVYGQTTVYIAPLPDQTYVSEWDTIIPPLDLSNGAPNETIPFPYTTGVSYWAAYKAKFKEQSYEEAGMFKKTYQQSVLASIRSSAQRRIPDPYV